MNNVSRDGFDRLRKGGKPDVMWVLCYQPNMPSGVRVSAPTKDQARAKLLARFRRNVNPAASKLPIGSKVVRVKRVHD